MGSAFKIGLKNGGGAVEIVPDEAGGGCHGSAIGRGSAIVSRGAVEGDGAEATVEDAVATARWG